MGFKEVRKRLIVALKAGRYSHEGRDVLAEKAYFLEDSPGNAVFISVHT